jgi:hypothetical protein
MRRLLYVQSLRDCDESSELTILAIFALLQSQFEFPLFHPTSDFLIPPENDLAHFGDSGKFIDQPRIGFRMTKSEQI